MNNHLDVMGSDPEDKPTKHGLILPAVCKNSFEFEMLARSREAMTAAAETLGREFEIEIIEDEPDAPAPTAPEPMDETERELAENADAILTALASLWMTRIAIARAVGEKGYRAACAAEGIEPL